MNLFNFIQQFPDETACRVHFKRFRDQEGVICKKCGCEAHYWLKSKQMYQCKECRFRTSLRSGTVMENSKLPFQYWYMAMHLMSSTKKCFSALELQRQLGHKRYEPIWYMMQKIRISMGKGDEKYMLSGTVEMDEAFFEAVPDHGKRPKKTKRGRGSERQEKVMVMAESEKVPNSNKTGKNRKCGYFKMIVVNDLTEKTLSEVAKESIHQDAKIISDGYRSYSRLKEYFRKHTPKVTPPEKAGKVLPWVHIAISNAKRTLLGIYHMIRGCYLQNYLDEFCFKLNRRYRKEKLFDSLLKASLTTWY